MTPLSKLKALAEGATREWRASVSEIHEGAEGDAYGFAAFGPTHDYEGDEDRYEAAQYDAEADARYIAAASPSTVLALVAEVERLRRELEWFADEGHYEGTYRRGAGYVDAVGLERARAALRGEPELPVVVDGECMQDCDAMGVPCPKRGEP